MWGLDYNQKQEDILIERFARYMKTNRICHFEELSNCVPDIFYKSVTNEDYANYANDTVATTRAAAELPDGTLFIINVRRAGIVGTDNCPIQLYIDLNGKAEPNKIGDDFFYFFITWDNKLVPAGQRKDMEALQNYFESACLNGSGIGCTNWVIEKGNRDYLRCKDLSYLGKFSCD